MSDRLLFHWSPTDRRPGVTAGGLKPGSVSVDRLWRPPYVCLADSPSLAWALSGMTERGQEHRDWDLWCVWRSHLTEYLPVLYDDDTERVKEYRVHETIRPDWLWYVGSRTHAPSLIRV